MRDFFEDSLCDYLRDERDAPPPPPLGAAAASPPRTPSRSVSPPPPPAGGSAAPHPAALARPPMRNYTLHGHGSMTDLTQGIVSASAGSLPSALVAPQLPSMPGDRTRAEMSGKAEMHREGLGPPRSPARPASAAPGLARSASSPDVRPPEARKPDFMLGRRSAAGADAPTVVRPDQRPMLERGQVSFMMRMEHIKHQEDAMLKRQRKEEFLERKRSSKRLEIQSLLEGKAARKEKEFMEKHFGHVLDDRPVRDRQQFGHLLKS